MHYPVSVAELSLKLRTFGYLIVQTQRATMESFLSAKESLLSQMYTSGTITPPATGEIPSSTAVKRPTIAPPSYLPMPSPIQPPTSPRILTGTPYVPGIKQPPTVIIPKLPSVSGVKRPTLPTVTTVPMRVTVPATASGTSTVSVTAEEEVEIPPTPTNVPERPLPGLTVMSTKSATAAGRGDDNYQPLTCTWYPKTLVRIACIGDGSCFFHAILKGFFVDYQNNGSYLYRTNTVTELRKELAYLLPTTNSYDPYERSFYDSVNEGQWTELAGEQVIMLSAIEELGFDIHSPRTNVNTVKRAVLAQGYSQDEFNIMLDSLGRFIDYSLPGLQTLLLSSRDVGDEIYKYVSEVLGITIVVLRATTTDLYTHINTYDGNHDYPWVFIVGNGYHYEVLAEDTPGGFRTTFSLQHSLVQAVLNP